jgi:putative transcriptional regulator
MSKSGARIISSAREALAYARGGSAEGFVVHVPEQLDVRSIRLGLGLSQRDFAARFGFDVRAVQNWEQKRRQPDAAARILLKVIALEPDAVMRALSRPL